MASQPKAIPHIVEVDKLGQPAYLGPLDRAAYRDFKPSTASIHYHLARFVRDTREITSDLAVLKRNWVDAYKLLTTNGSNFLNAYVQDHNPFQVVAAQVRVSLQINVVVQVSKDTWQVDWTETSTDEHGNPTETEVWRGTFHVLLRVPENTEELAANPLPPARSCVWALGMRGREEFQGGVRGALARIGDQGEDGHRDVGRVDVDRDGAGFCLELPWHFPQSSLRTGPPPRGRSRDG